MPFSPGTSGLGGSTGTGPRFGCSSSKAAGIFPADLARKLIGASADDWSLAKVDRPTASR